MCSCFTGPDAMLQTSNALLSYPCVLLWGCQPRKLISRVQISEIKVQDVMSILSLLHNMFISLQQQIVEELRFCPSSVVQNVQEHTQVVLTPGRSYMCTAGSAKLSQYCVCFTVHAFKHGLMLFFGFVKSEFSIEPTGNTPWRFIHQCYIECYQLSTHSAAGPGTAVLRQLQSR